MVEPITIVGGLDQVDCYNLEAFPGVSRATRVLATCTPYRTSFDDSVNMPEVDIALAEKLASSKASMDSLADSIFGVPNRYLLGTAIKPTMLLIGGAGIYGCSSQAFNEFQIENPDILEQKISEKLFEGMFFSRIVRSIDRG